MPLGEKKKCTNHLPATIKVNFAPKIGQDAITKICRKNYYKFVSKPKYYDNTIPTPIPKS